MIASRSDAVRELIVDGDYKKALHIAKGFRLGIGIEYISKIKLAYECLVHKGFYEQIGTDTAAAVDDGIQILKSIYGQVEEHS